MDSLRTVIFIILGIIYLVSKFKGKKPEQAATTDRPAVEPEKNISFEELLQEIQGSKKPAPPIQPATIQRYEEEGKKPLEQTNYSYRDQDKIYETYENAKQQAFSRPSMEETLKLENTIVRYGQFKSYSLDEQPSLTAQYARDLQDPASLKKAFILSEILNRRF